MRLIRTPSDTMNEFAMLRVDNLEVSFHTIPGEVRAVRGVSFEIGTSEIVGLIGETGCGKSVVAHAILQLLLPPGQIEGGSIRYRRKDETEVDIVQLGTRGKAIRSIRGQEISIVFQDPMTCLSPVHTLGYQISESIRNVDSRMPRDGVEERVVELLGQVGMPQPDRHIDSYPFELSGGMRQRAMIAVALAARPKLLLADEPTTAVDVTIQAKLLRLLRDLRDETHMSILFVSHDLHVVNRIAERIIIMYLGTIVEQGPASAIFSEPLHPYTRLLVDCVPSEDSTPKSELATISGRAPDPYDVPSGCPFHARCPSRIGPICDTIRPLPTMVASGHEVACHLHSPDEARA